MSGSATLAELGPVEKKRVARLVSQLLAMETAHSSAQKKWVLEETTLREWIAASEDARRLMVEENDSLRMCAATEAAARRVGKG